MDLIANNVANDGMVKIRIEAVGGALDKAVCRYPLSFMNEMARQLTSAIEEACGVEGLAESSVELVMMFAQSTYLEHISDNVTYRRLMLIDAVSAPRDFWVKWTRIGAWEGEYSAENILFELGEDVDHKIREKEHRYMLRSDGEKYHSSMGRKKVTEWREVIKRAAKRGDLKKIESDFELTPETLQLQERIAEMIGQRAVRTEEPVKEEIPYITHDDERYLRVMEKARMVVEEGSEEDESLTLADIADRIVAEAEASQEEIELVPEDEGETAAEADEIDFEEELDGEIEEIENIEEAEELEDSEADSEEIDIFADGENDEASDDEVDFSEESEPDGELDVFDAAEDELEEEIEVEIEVEIDEDPDGDYEEPEDELFTEESVEAEEEIEAEIEESDDELVLEDEAEEIDFDDESDEEFLLEEEAEDEPEAEIDETEEIKETEEEFEIEIVEEIEEEIPEEEVLVTIPEETLEEIAHEAPEAIIEEAPEVIIEETEEPIEEIKETEESPEKSPKLQPAQTQSEYITIADRVASIRAELENKIRLEYETSARKKAEAELVELRRELARVQTESERQITELAKENERLRVEYAHLVDQVEHERTARAAEEARLRLEEQQLREQIETQLRAEAAEHQRFAEMARMALEEKNRLEAENARNARQKEEEERMMEERRRREEHERELAALRQAELEKIRREHEEALARAKAAMPEMGDGIYSYTSKTVKFLFKNHVDPNITNRIQEIIKATVDYYGKEGVYLKIKASIIDSHTVILEFTNIPIEEMPLLGNIIKILGNSGLGISKAIVE